MKNYDLIIASGATICYNKWAKEFTALKTGGLINTLMLPKDEKSLLACLENTSNPIVLGGTTNSLISDSGINWEVVLMSGVKGIVIDGNYITAMAGETLSKVCKIARENCLTGMEELSGIPGTIGGAVCMNCGAFGRFISDILVCAKCFINGEIITLTNKDCNFGYRTSGIAKDNIVVLSATFKLEEHSQILISNKMKEYKNKRRLSQPNDLSLGSVFKKYNGVGAGYYIEKCGLKGKTIGGCMVSTKHANFIINTGDGCSTDYAKLALFVQNAVFEKFDIQLEREVKYFGEFIF